MRKNKKLSIKFTNSSLHNLNNSTTSTSQQNLSTPYKTKIKLKNLLNSLSITNDNYNILNSKYLKNNSSTNQFIKNTKLNTKIDSEKLAYFFSNFIANFDNCESSNKCNSRCNYDDCSKEKIEFFERIFEQIVSDCNEVCVMRSIRKILRKINRKKNV